VFITQKIIGLSAKNNQAINRAKLFVENNSCDSKKTNIRKKIIKNRMLINLYAILQKFLARNLLKFSQSLQDNARRMYGGQPVSKVRIEEDSRIRPTLRSNGQWKHW
jgi:hypothetical protein